MTSGRTRAVAGLAAAGLTCVAYGTFVERHWYRLRHVTLPGALRRRPDGSAPLPLRLLHLSDLHTQPGDERLEAFLAAVAGHDYDLVVLTGDLLGNVEVEQRCLDLLDPVLNGVPGFLVLGSNDVFGPTPKSPTHYFLDPDHRAYGPRLDTDRLMDGLAERGVVTVRGGTAAVETRIGRVSATGLDDPHLAGDRLPDVSALRLDDHPDDVVRLGLSHAPYTVALDLLTAAGADLLLSGHTHGGQVRFPPVGAVVGNCDLPLDQVRGPSRYADRWLHVSPGLGTSPYAPFRFACRPEATLLHLTV